MSRFLKFSKFSQWLSYAEEYPSSFKVCHKFDPVYFDWELLVTDNARTISKHMLFLKILLYSLGVTLNVHEQLSVG